jgi:methylated-DNA-protein-cysteine methyltransferase-like protein
MSDLRPRIYAAVCAIPAGFVSTYGSVAQQVGTTARQVGYALAALSVNHPLLTQDVPWQRVINAQGRVSIHNPWGYQLQKQLLMAEGVVFDDIDTVDLVRFGWRWA